MLAPMQPPPMITMSAAIAMALAPSLAAPGGLRYLLPSQQSAPKEEMRPMSYYLRVYCKAPTSPTLRQLLALMVQEDISLRIDPRYAEQDLDAPDWREVGLVHAEGQ